MNSGSIRGFGKSKTLLFARFAGACFQAGAFIANGTFVVQGVWTLLSGLG
jgi:hypothetical protein